MGDETFEIIQKKFLKFLVANSKKRLYDSL